MTRTIYYTATSIDGFIADEHNSLDWLLEVPRPQDDGGTTGAGDSFDGFFASVGAFAMGSTTFEWVVEHEDLRADPHKWREWYGGVPGWVFTHRDLDGLEGADIRFVAGDVAPVHADMVAAADGRDVWLVGGGELVGAFADAGLLDEIHLAVQPVLLGAGAPLLPRRLTSHRLTLRSVHHALDRGGRDVELVYDVGAPEPPGP